jgi:opacity protein-like surface antigen
MTLRRLAALLAALCAAAALPARADDDPPPTIPSKGDATIAVLGAWHAAPQHDFVAEQQRDGFNPQHKLFQPTGLLSLGFAADEEFQVTIDLGYGIDSYQLTTGTANVSSVSLLLGADTPFYANRYLTLYGGGGLGYSLNNFTNAGTSVESNSSAGYLKVGMRLRLSSKIAFVVEDRYIVSSALWPALHSNFTVGGNLLSAGFMFHFFSPADAGHPAGPSDR